jgi:hypothetical protein
MFRFLAGRIQSGRALRQGLGKTFHDWIARLSPGGSQQPASLSRFTMIFIAIAVPLVIVTGALYIYQERGLRQLYQLNYGQALQAAQQTINQTNPNILRNAWSETLNYLDKADQNLPDRDESIALRKQAQTSLDGLDAIVRLDYQPAINGGLSDSVNITQIIANTSDIYLLNTAQGRIIHALLTGTGYEVDPTFNCSSGPSGGITIGKLIHMSPMPRGNEFNATLLTIDEGGNVLFCGPGIDPKSVTLGTPDSNWGKLAAMVYDNDILYILDPPNNAVWVYKGTDNFREKPHLYFGSEVPHIADATDMEVVQDYLYLLHADGHLTQCTTSNGDCTDPFPYADPRPGLQSSVKVMPETQFSLMQYTQPPDPSIYLLDSSVGSIYHFSLRMNYQRQFRPNLGTGNPFPPQKPATALAISPNRMAFIAFGSQVFYALMP